jgi:transposase-like protein
MSDFPTPQQLIVLEALANGATVTDAAAAAGVHRNTIGNWRRETKNFQIALANAQYDRACLYREKAEALVDLAIQAIRDILADPKASPSVRLKAALAIMQIIGKQMEPQKPVTATADEFMLAQAPLPVPGMHNPAQPHLHRSSAASTGI